MKVHVFFVGGTGARIFRAFVHCLASGVFHDLQTSNIEFCSYCIDSDISNDDGEKASQIANSYKTIHQYFFSDVVKPTECHFFSIPLHHHAIQVPNTLPGSDLYDVSMLKENTLLFFSALLGDMRMGLNNILNKELLTYLAMSSIELEEFEKNFDSQEDIVILIGSTFGITGYSVLPQLASRIVKKVREDESMQCDSRVAMVCVGPYFEVDRPNRLLHHDFNARHAVFEYYCHKVLKEQLHEMSTYNILPINGTDRVEYEERGTRQCHLAHIVELCAVSAIIDFIKRQTTKKCELSLKLEPRWSSVTPDVLPEDMREGIDSLLCFYIWCRQFGKRPYSNDETIIRYAEGFCNWLQEMEQHVFSFSPLFFDREKLSQSFRWYIPKKKYGLFNSDPLDNKKLDRLYRKTFHSTSSSLLRKNKELLVQYKVCTSAWELFKNSCHTGTYQLHNNGWDIYQPESSLLYVPAFFHISLPTFFSRLWLCDIAFTQLATQKQYPFNGYNDRSSYFLSSIASECLDLLEFLYYSGNTDLKIKRISIEGVIHELENCGPLDVKWLLETLNDNKKLLPSKFAESDIFIFVFRGHVIGGTSPFSLVFTSPQCKELFYSWSSEFGHRFNNDPVPFERRSPSFQKYIKSVLASSRQITSISRYVYSFNNETRNISFDGFGNQDSNSFVQDFESDYIPITDGNCHKVTIVTDEGGQFILCRPFIGCANPGILLTFQPATTNSNSEDEVYSSIFSQAEVRRKSHMLVQVYLHLYEETEKVKLLAQESDKNAERRDYIPLQCKLKRGDKVDVILNIYGETLLMSDKKCVIWQGSFTKCSFDYFVPKDIDVDELSCVALLSVNGVPVGEMRFITKIVESPRQLNPEIIAHKYSKVFISYSHQDESKVKFLHEGLELGSVPHFFDRKYLKAGDVFPQVIQDYINSADLFILCWSENASKSEYVKKERLQALERAFPQVKPEQAAKLRIYPMSIEPRAELPGDMKENYHFGEI